MSDYFGALMNSSGLAAAARPSALPAAGLSSADVDIVETDGIREMAADPATPTTPPAAPPAQAPAMSDRTAEREIAPTIQVAPSVAGAPASMQASAAETNDAATAPTPADARMQVAPAAAAPPAPAAAVDVRSHAVVRAALDWVAADPQNAARSRPPTAAATAPARLLPSPAKPLPEAPPRIVVDQVRIPTVAVAPPTNAVQPAPIPHDRPREQVRSGAHAAASAAPDEIVEISIGAIHVRLDTPAPQTVAAATPVPASPTRPSSDRSVAHSGLARRALRRI
jgi:hypothetical protein